MIINNINNNWDSDPGLSDYKAYMLTIILIIMVRNFCDNYYRCAKDNASCFVPPDSPAR